MKHKFNVTIIFSILHKMIKTQFDTKSQIVNNGIKCFNQCLPPYFEKKYIIHQSYCIDTLQQNGVAKQENRYLLKVTRALIFQIDVSKTY